MPGATLTIERNVELHIWPNVRILVLGNLIADGTLWQPIRFKPINITEFSEQHGRVGTRYKRIASKKHWQSINEESSMYDDYVDTDPEFWRRQKHRNSDTLWWKRYRRRNKRHNIDSRYVEYRTNRKATRNLMKRNRR